jgi:hypothetical protein
MFMAAAMLGAGEAQAAMSCWNINGWSYPSGPNYAVATLGQVSCQTTSVNSGWMEAVDLYNLTSDEIWLQVSLSDSHVISGQFYSTPTYTGSSNGTPSIQLDILLGWDNLYDLQTEPPDPCGADVTWWDNTLVSPWFDSANCYVDPVPSGETGFVYNNNYYITPDPTPFCMVGTYDSANCWIGNLPSGSTPYIYQDVYLFVTQQTGGGCGIGSPSMGGCFIADIGEYAQDFIWKGNLYITAIPTCSDGKYDGANCLVGSAPSGTTAFVWPNSSGSFYYAP